MSAGGMGLGFDGGSNKSVPLAYPTMGVEAIKALPVGGMAEKDAHLYLWTTASHLRAAFDVISALGFRYVSNVVWVKRQPGLGQYFRGKHELLLFATRGKGFEVRTERRDLPSAILSEHVRDETGKRVHSAKPEAFYELVEARSRGPFAEFFARRPRAGWAAWGNELKIEESE
jgi:N6-adenosine-specific RNA methylase IME4